MDFVINQLECIGISRDDQGVDTLSFGLLAQRAQHIIRFVSFQCEYRYMESFQHFHDALDLVTQLIWHLGAMSFIFRILLMPEGSAHVKRDADVCRLPVPESIEEHRRETVHGINYLTPPGSQVQWQGMECSIGKGMSIYQYQRVAGIRCRFHVASFHRG